MIVMPHTSAPSAWVQLQQPKSPGLGFGGKGSPWGGIPSACSLSGSWSQAHYAAVPHLVRSACGARCSYIAADLYARRLGWRSDVVPR